MIGESQKTSIITKATTIMIVNSLQKGIQLSIQQYNGNTASNVVTVGILGTTAIRKRPHALLCIYISSSSLTSTEGDIGKCEAIGNGVEIVKTGKNLQ